MIHTRKVQTSKFKQKHPTLVLYPEKLRYSHSKRYTINRHALLKNFYFIFIFILICIAPYMNLLFSQAGTVGQSRIYLTTVPGSSEPNQDEWPMFRGQLNHTGVAHTIYIVGPFWNYSTESIVNSSPAVAGGCVYVGSNDDQIYCLNATDGVKVWNYTTGGDVQSSPAIVDGKLYVGSNDDR
ncbi:MAG: PQQ-binding-like beta-propeller repeat protein, partial [Candidatus Helarchaeota archaeon]|nr:PQQ-binding-like beta-propeller repeat protein [Candidatus Helarchaeota archaeon]